MAISKCGSFTVGKGWRRTIGVKVGDGGRLMPCRFWLGMDKPRATATALQIESLWVGLDSPYWTPEAFQMAEAIRVGATAKNAAEATAEPLAVKPLVKPTTILTVRGLIERFRASYLADSRLTQASKNSYVGRTKTLERSPICNMPLEAVGAEELAQLISFWLARPNNLNGEPISEYSARMLVKTARAVFDFADAVGLWTSPRRFDRLFRLPRATCQPTIKTFSLDELVRLYRSADDQMKMLILLGLNCGFCSSELATLKQNEIDLKAKTIKRARQKTSVKMSWSLWGETVKALQHGMARNGGSNELAFIRENGQPLVSFNADNRRLDFIPHAWNGLLKRANKGNETPIVGSFKLLRKTGATMIRAIGGIEVSEMYLAHSEKSMARFYSTPNHDQLTMALTAFRKQLAPMFKGAKASQNS